MSRHEGYWAVIDRPLQAKGMRGPRWFLWVSIGLEAAVAVGLAVAGFAVAGFAVAGLVAVAADYFVKFAAVEAGQ